MQTRSSLSLLLGFGIFTGSILATVREAKADHCYGAFAIRNPSNTAIHYQIRWGNGDWQSICVYPGHSYSHWNALDENGRVPTPQVRFDWIAGDGQASYKTYDVQVYSTYYPSSGGKKYVFRFSSCGCYVDLYNQ